MRSPCGSFQQGDQCGRTTFQAVRREGQRESWKHGPERRLRAGGRDCEKTPHCRDMPFSPGHAPSKAGNRGHCTISANGDVDLRSRDARGIQNLTAVAASLRAAPHAQPYRPPAARPCRGPDPVNSDESEHRVPHPRTGVLGFPPPGIMVSCRESKGSKVFKSPALGAGGQNVPCLSLIQDPASPS